MSCLPLSSPPSGQSKDQPPQASQLLPSPLPDTYTSRYADEGEHPPHDSIPSLAPPYFTPFFTLLTSPTSSSTHHPTVQYIFSDDTPDNDPITSAALQVLDPSSTSSSPVLNAQDGQQNNRDVRERFVLIDMDATGSKVLSAQSMSPDWAVTSTVVGEAPTWEGRQGENGENDGEATGLMLRIEGMEVLGDGVDGKRKREELPEEKTLEELAEVFERRMRELRRVVDAGAGDGGYMKGEDE